MNPCEKLAKLVVMKSQLWKTKEQPSKPLMVSAMNQKKPFEKTTTTSAKKLCEMMSTRKTTEMRTIMMTQKTTMMTMMTKHEQDLFEKRTTTIMMKRKQVLFEKKMTTIMMKRKQVLPERMMTTTVEKEPYGMRTMTMYWDMLSERRSKMGETMIQKKKMKMQHWRMRVPHQRKTLAVYLARRMKQWL